MASNPTTQADIPQRNILVAGATGKQGTALIHALLHHPSTQAEAQPQFHIYALTRNSSSPAARRLSGQKDITVVQGDLDVRDSISRIFEHAKSRGGIWGVFAVLAFPGLGAPAEGEERQGKMLADLALEFGVEVFLYSSAARFGPRNEDRLSPSYAAKMAVEKHCISLGDKGLPWIILRPGFFMENFDGLIGAIGVTVIKTGLKHDTEIGFIASEDIGNVAAAVLRDHGKYKNLVMVCVGEHLTMSQLEESYKRGAGRAIPSIPSALAWLIKRLNASTQNVINDLERYHLVRTAGLYPELNEEIRLANEACHMKTYYEWVSQGQGQKPKAAEGQEAWNNLTVGRLLMGRFNPHPNP